MNQELRKRRWMDEHYPRCVKCGLRTYVNNFTGRRDAEITGQPGCPDWDNPDREPAYPYTAEHELTQ